MTITIKNNGATLIGAKNPQYMDEDNIFIVLEAKFSHYADIGITENDGYMTFVCNPDDYEPHGREMHAQALAGEYGTIADFVPVEE
jgi:hypothetical protein